MLSFVYKTILHFCYTNSFLMYKTHIVVKAETIIFLKKY
jgi:hypothetical protein